VLKLALLPVPNTPGDAPEVHREPAVDRPLQPSAQ
jgi:hypothetical protein